MSTKPSETPKTNRWTIEEIAAEDAAQMAAESARMKPKPEACGECRFFRPLGGSEIPACHRYPEHVRVASWHWCGEFDRKRGDA